MRRPNVPSTAATIGILAMSAAATVWAGSAAAANIVVNGDFATGDLTGFVTSGNSAGIAVGTGVGPAGGNALGIGNLSPLGFVTQALPTVAGESYILSYQLDAPDVSAFPTGSIEDEFLVNVGGDASSGVLVGGNTLFDQTNLPALPIPVPYNFAALFADESFAFTATSASTNLIFGGFDAPSFTILADISVTPAPEPQSLAILATGLAGLGWMRRRAAG